MTQEPSNLQGPGEDSSAKIKSKNRLAQKRYRDRQKAKKCGIEDQVAVLQRRLEELETTQASLRGRNKSLERCVELSETMPWSHQQVPSKAEGATLRAAEDDTLVGAVADGIALMRDQSPTRSPAQLQRAKRILADPELLREKRKETCIKLYQMMGSMFNPEPQAKEEVIAYIQKLRQVKLSMMKYLHVPLSKAVNAATPPRPPGSLPQQLPQLVAHLNLSKHQEEALLSLRRDFCKEAALIGTERSTILHSLRKVNEPGRGSWESFHVVLNEAAEMHSQLQDTFHSQTAAMHRFAVGFNEVITPWQEAHIMAEAMVSFGIIVEPWDIVNFLEQNAVAATDNDDAQMMPFLDMLLDPLDAFPAPEVNQCQALQVSAV